MLLASEVVERVNHLRTGKQDKLGMASLEPEVQGTSVNHVSVVIDTN